MASQASVTIGSDLSRTGNIDHNCGGGCTIVQTALPGRQLTAPFSGVIVRWRVRDYGSGSVTLRVLRQLTFGASPPVSYSFLRSSVEQTSGSPGVVSYAVSPPLPISAGDTIAVTTSGDNASGANLVSGAQDAVFGSAAPADGATSDTAINSNGDDWLYNADVVGPPTSTATAAPCPGGSTLTVAVEADPDPATGPQSVHYKVDGGPEQVVATTGNPGLATIQLPAGVHSVEYWGQDQLGLQEPTHHTLGAGCSSAGSGAPALRSAALSSKTFRAARSGASLSRAPIGTTVRYQDSQAAVTTFKVLAPRAGHRTGKRCVAGRAHGRHCTRYVSLGSFTHRDSAGAVSVHFSGRVRGHALKPGRYRLTLTPRAAGKQGRTITLAFKIVK